MVHAQAPYSHRLLFFKSSFILVSNTAKVMELQRSQVVFPLVWKCHMYASSLAVFIQCFIPSCIFTVQSSKYLDTHSNSDASFNPINCISRLPPHQIILLLWIISCQWEQDYFQRRKRNLCILWIWMMPHMIYFRQAIAQ